MGCKLSARASAPNPPGPRDASPISSPDRLTNQILRVRLPRSPSAGRSRRQQHVTEVTHRSRPHAAVPSNLSSTPIPARVLRRWRGCRAASISSCRPRMHRNGRSAFHMDHPARLHFSGDGGDSPTPPPSRGCSPVCAYALPPWTPPVGALTHEVGQPRPRASPLPG